MTRAKTKLAFTKRQAIAQLNAIGVALPLEARNFLEEVAAFLDGKRRFPPVAEPKRRYPLVAAITSIRAEMNDLIAKMPPPSLPTMAEEDDETAYKIVRSGRKHLPETWRALYEKVRTHQKRRGQPMPKLPRTHRAPRP